MTTPSLSGWGRVFGPGQQLQPDDLVHAPEVPLFRGLGRSYGDSSLPPPSRPQVVSTVRADRILHFDSQTGLLRAEAGLSLFELNKLFFPRGWFSPVTPGTQFVTLGGMVAADVHGKNHHVDGTFGAHVTRLRLKVASGQVLECGPDLERELFCATVGGMGLTGHILEVEFALRKIPSPWLWQESERVPNIDAYLEGLSQAAKEWPMTMGWIDCLSRGKSMGRGILMKARWAQPHEAPAHFPKTPSLPRVPFQMPSMLLGPRTVKAFNFVYYWKHLPKKKAGIVHPWSSFYPLDAARDWNLLYGKRGFTQYQCVLPESGGAASSRRFLELLTRHGGASFLCVIKDCGAQGSGLLSFPMPGTSIAVDLPIRDGTPALIDALNAFVIAQGGRIYLAKDGFTSAAQFAQMEPRLEAFQKVRRQWDPHRKLKSAQSIRVLGDPA